MDDYLAKYLDWFSWNICTHTYLGTSLFCAICRPVYYDIKFSNNDPEQFTLIVLLSILPGGIYVVESYTNIDVYVGTKP